MPPCSKSKTPCSDRLYVLPASSANATRSAFLRHLHTECRTLQHIELKSWLQFGRPASQRFHAFGNHHAGTETRHEGNRWLNPSGTCEVERCSANPSSITEQI